MRIPSERLKLSIALALITSFTVHLLWYPFYGEHLARNGDQKALHAIRQWHFWNPFFILGLATGWALLFRIMRQSGDRSRVIASVASATWLLAIIVLELLLMAAYAYIRYSLFRV
jgi:hypothetical protein